MVESVSKLAGLSSLKGTNHLKPKQSKRFFSPNHPRSTLFGNFKQENLVTRKCGIKIHIPMRHNVNENHVSQFYLSPRLRLFLNAQTLQGLMLEIIFPLVPRPYEPARATLCNSSYHMVQDTSIEEIWETHA